MINKKILNYIFENYNEDINEKLKILTNLFYEFKKEDLLFLIKDDINYYYSKDSLLNHEIWLMIGINIFLKELMIYIVKENKELKIKKLKLLIETINIHKTTVNDILIYCMGNELDNIIFKSNNFNTLIKML